MKHQTTITIELTNEQKEQLKRMTGQNVLLVKLDLELLEARLAPAITAN